MDVYIQLLNEKKTNNIIIIYIYTCIYIRINISDVLIQAPAMFFLDCYPGWHLNPGFMGRRPTSCLGAQDGLGNISLLQISFSK